MLLLKHGWSALYPIQHSNHTLNDSYELLRACKRRCGRVWGWSHHRLVESSSEETLVGSSSHQDLHLSR